MALELHGWLSRRSEFAKFILYTTLMLLPLALAASLYTGNWLLPLLLGFFLLYFLVRVLFFALFFSPVFVAVLMIWMGYNYLIKNRSKKTGDNDRTDNQDSVRSSR